ncbi:hypothetical protein FQR65_LT15605 [Abscondita terminalis]|nr:hypothetical protein FQR65_LT15605 [Abscondita terminalis]
MSRSGQRFGYFMKDGKQYQVIGQIEDDKRATPLDLSAIFVKNNLGQLVQLEKSGTAKRKKSSPPATVHNNRYMSATVSAVLAPGEFVYTEESVPALPADYTLLRMKKTGNMRNGLPLPLKGTQPFFSYPRILGTNIAAEVIVTTGKQS